MSNQLNKVLKFDDNEGEVEETPTEETPTEETPAEEGEGEGEDE